MEAIVRLLVVHSPKLGGRGDQPLVPVHRPLPPGGLYPEQEGAEVAVSLYIKRGISQISKALKSKF
jgi:hypothetical protein